MSNSEVGKIPIIIKLEDLIPSAIMILYELCRITKISLDLLSQYGELVKEELKHKQDRDVITLSSYSYLTDFLEENKQFSFIDDEYVALADGVTIEELKNNSSNASIYLLLVLFGDKATELLKQGQEYDYVFIAHTFSGGKDLYFSNPEMLLGAELIRTDTVKDDNDWITRLIFSLPNGRNMLIKIKQEK